MKKLAIIDAQLAPHGFMECLTSMCHAANVECDAFECETNDDIIANVDGYASAICFFAQMNRTVLSQMPHLEQVVRVGIGVDNLNLTDFSRHGIYACNTPDYGIEEVAVHTLSLILALERNLISYNNATAQGVWEQRGEYEMQRISQRTLGLFGFGRIAQKLASLAQPLGYSILTHDPYVDAAICNKAGITRTSLGTLLRESHVLTLLAPATEKTHHIINEDTLAQARDGVLLVNTSRGSLVSTDALIDGLDQKKIRGAALDVLEEEPPKKKCVALLGNDNVILTPHIAYRSEQSLKALNSMSIQVALDYLCENKVRNLVNPQVLRSVQNPKQ